MNRTFMGTYKGFNIYITGGGVNNAESGKFYTPELTGLNGKPLYFQSLTEIKIWIESEYISRKNVIGYLPYPVILHREHPNHTQYDEDGNIEGEKLLYKYIKVRIVGVDKHLNVLKGFSLDKDICFGYCSASRNHFIADTPKNRKKIKEHNKKAEEVITFLRMNGNFERLFRDEIKNTLENKNVAKILDTLED